MIGPYGERMEVQIRTREMHRDAELGIAAHWKYKAGVSDRRSGRRKFAWLRQLLERHQDVDDPNEFIETVKVDLFPDEVFVFTPRATSSAFRAAPPRSISPTRSTARWATRAPGAKVNGRMVPLRHGPCRRRYGRGHDQHQPGAAEGLARVRDHGQGAQSDPPLDSRRGDGPQPPARPRDPRPRAAEDGPVAAPADGAGRPGDGGESPRARLRRGPDGRDRIRPHRRGRRGPGPARGSGTRGRGSEATSLPSSAGCDGGDPGQRAVGRPRAVREVLRPHSRGRDRGLRDPWARRDRSLEGVREGLRTRSCPTDRRGVGGRCRGPAPYQDSSALPGPARAAGDGDEDDLVCRGSTSVVRG